MNVSMDGIARVMVNQASLLHNFLPPKNPTDTNKRVGINQPNIEKFFIAFNIASMVLKVAKLSAPFWDNSVFRSPSLNVYPCFRVCLTSSNVSIAPG